MLRKHFDRFCISLNSQQSFVLSYLLEDMKNERIYSNARYTKSILKVKNK